MMGRLGNKIAIITGGSRGMGEATARLFAQEGAKVVICDISVDQGEALARDIGPAALFQRLDVSSEEGWQKTVQVAADRFGGVDILVNNAGIVMPKDIIEETKAGFERTLTVNLTGCFLGIRYCAPLMLAKKKGSIVNISSTEGLRGTSHMAAYTASKWGIRGLTKATAIELGRGGIRVNSVHPGVTATEMLRPDDFAGTITELPFFKALLSRQPISRFASPVEIARVSLFLASDEASYVTGAEIAADGGMVSGIFSNFADEEVELAAR